MDALKTYSIPMIVALIVTALIQLLKKPSIPINIPPRAQPYVALASSLVLAMAARVIQMGIEQDGAVDVWRALLDGFLGGLTSVGLFEAVKNAAPQDKPPPAPPKDPGSPPGDPYRASGTMRVALATVFAIVAFGCGAGADVMRVVQVSSEVIARAEPCLVLQYEAQQEDCLDESTDEARRTCVARVREAWKPVVDALSQLREVRCGLEPQKCEASR